MRSILMGEKSLSAFVAQEARESYIGTAPRVELWVLLEYLEWWDSKVIAKSRLSFQVKTWLEHAKKLYPHTRVQLIKRHSQPEEGMTCFIGISQEDRQALYQFQLQCYEDVLDLDLPAIVARQALYDPFLFKEPLFLVCTHEEHNHCCGTFGLPLYVELVNALKEHAWQTTHLGGDRFAANMVCLPHGIYY